jgi:hypothetical protein
VTLYVPKDILQWLNDNPGVVKVARLGPNGLSYRDPTTINLTEGTVTLTTSLQGRYVFVAAAFKNDYMSGPSAILTHWLQVSTDAPPDGRGTQFEGANDYVSLADTISLDLHGNEVFDWVGEFQEDCPSAATLNPGTPTLRFLMDDYALFSDGTEDSRDFVVPSAERFIGENWTQGISKYVCVWRSDRVRSSYGWPLMVRNGEQAMDHDTAAPQRVIPNIPLIQVVNAIPVKPPVDDLTFAGNEHSLITIVLPPRWVPTSYSPTSSPPWSLPMQPEYPILLLSYYDLNSTVFSHPSDPLFNAIGRLSGDYEHDGGYVGVVWNCGGNGACQSKQLSSHENAVELFHRTRDLAGGDPQRVVMTGASRGGTAALSIGANPYHKGDYRVQYVVANTPVVGLGELGPYYDDPTYPLVQTTSQDLTGYCNGWNPDWVVPHTGGRTTWEYCNYVLFGTYDQDLIRLEYDNNSPAFIDALLGDEEGVEGVVIRCGTHDFSKPFSMAAHYYDALRAAYPNETASKVRFEISYRFGHTYEVKDLVPDDDEMPDEALFMDHLINNSPGVPIFHPGLHEYRRDGETGTSVQEGIEIYPCFRPLVFEAPLQVGHMQNASYTFVGAPGTEYKVEYVYYIETTDNCSATPIVPALIDDVLPAVTGTVMFSSKTHKLAVSNPNPTVSDQTIVLRLTYSIPGGPSDVVLCDAGFAPPEPPIPYAATAVLMETKSPTLGIPWVSRTSGFSTEGWCVDHPLDCDCSR